MSSHSQIDIQAPCDGIFMSLAEVPDEAFASGQLGPGIAFEPLGEVLKAPCNGTVVMCAATQHALSLRIGDPHTENSPELLIHLGLDSVELNGRGLTLLVQAGEEVQQGTELLRFDADVVASKATSLITPMVLIAGEELRIAPEPFGRVTEGELVARATYDTPQVDTAAQGDSDTAECSVQVALEAGLHARPAAKLKAIAERYTTRLTLICQGKEADAGHLSALIGLGIVQGSTVRLRAQGGNATPALEDAATLLSTAEGTAAPRAVATTPTTLPPVEARHGQIAGECASPGLAVAPIAILKHQAIEVNQTSLGASAETQRLKEALNALRKHLESQRNNAQQQEDGQIMEAHLAWLDDPGLIDPALDSIAQGASAGVAWQQSLEQQCVVLEQSPNALIRSRADDLRDLSQRLLLILENKQETGLGIPAGAIVVADELTPSQMMQLDGYRPAGLCVGNGGPTSHVAILARARNLPALVGAGKNLQAVVTHTLTEGSVSNAILDANAGILDLAPDNARIEAAQARIQALSTATLKAQAAASEPAYSLDGKLIEVAANIGSGEEALEAFRKGADGIGLLRSEFLFLDQTQAPSVETQQASYQAALDAAAGKPVIVRLLDIGADKQLAYLDLGTSNNPALGIRGARLANQYAELLSDQLCALLKCHTGSSQPLRIMLPMVSDIEDVRAVRALLDAQIQALGLTGHHDFVPPQLGIMIEVPAAALGAERLAQEVDFFSIGTNDLTQYCLAMDREEDQLASRLDALHPAVLRLVQLCVEGAKRHNRWVGVCGAAAGDELAAAALLALGVDELSTEPGRVAILKSQVRQMDIGRLAACIDQVFTMENGAAVRAWLRGLLTE